MNELMKLKLSALLHLIEESLWTGSMAGRRSQELTPLFIDRYRAPRFDPISGHHDFWELSCVIAGTGLLHVEEAMVMKPGDVFLIPPGVEHREESEQTMDTIWVGVAGLHLPPNPKKTLLVKSKSLMASVEDLWLFAQKRGSSIGPELDGRTAALVGRFFRLLSEEPTGLDRSLGARVVRFLEEHFPEPIKLEELARHFGCSGGYLSRTFRHQIGSPPMTYLNEIRLRHAKFLLQNSHFSIAEVAQKTGFSDQFYFSRLFHKLTALSPSEFRKSH